MPKTPRRADNAKKPEKTDLTPAEVKRIVGLLDDPPAAAISAEAIDSAQDKAFDAMQATTPGRQIKLLKDALAISPLCADAYSLLSGYARKKADAIALLRKGVEAGERALGPQVFEEDAGYFWGFVQTRPYMRARHMLAMSLAEAGQHDEAISHYEEMLRLNPADNQGIRDWLLHALLETGRNDEAAGLIARYRDDDSAVWLWSKALLAFRTKGDKPAARKALARAVEGNAYVAEFLSGTRKMPRFLPDFYGLGDENEAVLYVNGGAAAWAATPGALAWLKAARGGGVVTGDIPGADPDRIDEAVLALLLLGLHDGQRAWKGFDGEALNRLHAKGMISDPKSKAKFVSFSAEGLKEARKLYEKMFASRAK